MANVTFPADLIPGFTMKVRQEGTFVSAACSGSLDASDAIQRLQPEFLKLHSQLVEAKVDKVDLDMQAVEYMNSSAIKCFMAWFLKAEQARGGHTYTIRVMYDSNRTWQYVSFSTMERIAPKVLKMAAVQAQPK